MSGEKGASLDQGVTAEGAPSPQVQGIIRVPRHDGAGVTVAPQPVEPRASAVPTAPAPPERPLTVPAPRPTKGSDGP